MLAGVVVRGRLNGESYASLDSSRFRYVFALPRFTLLSLHSEGIIV